MRKRALPDPFLHLPASPQGGNATERGERLDNPYTGVTTKDNNGLRGRGGATDQDASSPTWDFIFVDALENVLGIDINGDGYKGQGYGVVNGLEAVSRWMGQGRNGPRGGGLACSKYLAVCAVSRSGNVRKGESRMRMAADAMVSSGTGDRSGHRRRWRGGRRLRECTGRSNWP